MGTLLREPLLHFMLLGAGLFLLYGWAGGPSAGEGESIVITQGRVEQLANTYARMHQRAPEAADLDALIEDAIREEIYYREAKALALDEDDTIVRRRLQQKLEFVSEDLVPIPEPSDAQLQAYLQAHPGRFRGERRYSLRHAYLNPERHGPELDSDTQSLLKRLKGGVGEDSAGGDPFLLGHSFDSIHGDELARLFGKEFEAGLRTLPLGEWQGPISSGYGTHLVYLRERVDEHAPPLAAVRSAVRKEWIGAQRRQANERFYADLRKRYSVTVERAAPASASGGSARVAGMLP